MSKPEPLTREELARLRAVAEAATPGPWHRTDKRTVVGDRGWVASKVNEVNGAFMVGFDPPTVLRLLDMVERLIRARSQR